MNLKSIATLAAAIVATSAFAGSPEAKCGAGSCSKKETTQKDSSCSKKEASCSKKEAACSKKDSDTKEAACSKK